MCPSPPLQLGQVASLCPGDAKQAAPNRTGPVGAESSHVAASGGGWQRMRLWSWAWGQPGTCVALGLWSARGLPPLELPSAIRAALCAAVSLPTCLIHLHPPCAYPSHEVCISTGAQELVFGPPAPAWTARWTPRWLSCALRAALSPSLWESLLESQLPGAHFWS